MISATDCIGIFWANININESISKVKPALLLAHGTLINLIDPHFLHSVRGTLA
jgi:hypothetical protein